jgi:hypothetical protein
VSGPGRSWIVALCASLVFAAPAAAADERVNHIARALERSPVYVSDSMSRRISDDDVEEIRAEVERMPFPTYVVIAPGFGAEPGLLLFHNVIPQLNDRLDRDGLYVVSDETGISLGVQAFGVRPKVPPRWVEAAVDDDVSEYDVAGRVRYAVELSRTGQRHEVTAEEDELPRGLLIAIGCVAAVGAFGGLTTWRRVKGVAALPVRPPLEPSEADFRPRAHEALDELAQALEAAPDPPDEAFEAQRAASKAIEDARRPVDWVGAFVLASNGLAAVRDQSSRPCFFNPLHRRAKRRTRWKRGPKTIEIPACNTCERALKTGRRPQELHDEGKPYWERDTVWARTGFGALDEDVALAVLRGELSRRGAGGGR